MNKEPGKKGENKTAHQKKAILKALEKSLGVVTTACNATGIGRRTYYEWLANDPNFKNSVKDLESIALDFAESHLHKQIKAGNSTSTIFYLKTKGKHRGYVEKMEIDQRTEHSGEVSINADSGIEAVTELLGSIANKLANSGYSPSGMVGDSQAKPDTQYKR